MVPVEPRRVRWPTSASWRTISKISYAMPTLPHRVPLSGFRREAASRFARRQTRGPRCSSITYCWRHSWGPTRRPIAPTAAARFPWGLPRVLGLVFLNRIGITAFNNLPVIRFALRADLKDMLTPEYSYSLWVNFRPHRNYRHDLSNRASSMAVVLGEFEEQSSPERFAAE